MKQTGPTKQSTRDLVVALEQHGKKTKQAVYKTLSDMMSVSTRIRAEVNVEHLNEMGTRNKDKVLVVPGKVMAKGDIMAPIEVAAFAFSASAKHKIEAAKGKTWTLQQLIEKNVPGQKMVLVK